MRFNPHSELEGKHALLSASKPYWINDDAEALLERAAKANAAAYGTRLHIWAAETIRLGRKQPNTSQTLNLYINDCIGYRMQVEQPLFYSWNAFGTADAISFRMEDSKPTLRIFDLKTGTSKTSPRQLMVYAALFCLEYKQKPMSLEYDLRIYQNDEIIMFDDLDPEEIAYVYDRIVEADKLISTYEEV